MGSGMIRFVWKFSPPNGGEFRSGKVTETPVTGSITLATGTTFPALSCQVWKWQISVPPMLSRMRRTSTLVALCAKDGYRLVPPCSIHAKVKSRGVGDGLKETAHGNVGVGSGNRGVLAHGERWNGVAKRVAQIGVPVPASVPRPPIGVEQ